MKSRNLFIKQAAVILLAVALAFAFVSSARAGTNVELVCTGNNGSWSGPNEYTGTCTYADGTAMADAHCSGTDNYEVYYNTGSETGNSCVVVVTTPPTAEATCAGAGGSWSGADSDNGDCFYAANSSSAVFACGSGYEYTETYVTGSLSSSTCTAANDNTGGGSQGSEGRTSDGNSDQPVTLTLGSGQNGSATFPPGSCPQKCTVGSNLPSSAKSSLPSDAQASMYVRVVDEGGNPGTGSYTVCFKNPDHQPVTIYRFVGGVWVAVMATSGSPICTTASGDGAFYLGS